MEKNEVIEKIAKKIFQLFIANPKALAIQQDSGHYITKYISFDYKMIANMYRRNGSAGCYQQGLKNNKIKWICLDFDCKDTKNPNIKNLLEYLHQTILQKLKQLNISYLLEYSGRRGIHIWILFSSPITKENGYSILVELCKDINLNNELYGLDKFPATDNSEGNKVGKQVKIPLSVHKKGGRSYFLENEVFPLNINDDLFFDSQLIILDNYNPNDINEVNKKLNIDPSQLLIQSKYKTIISKNNVTIKLDDIITCLSKIQAYRNIFDRLEHGTLISNDWNVLLGTFGPLDENGDLLASILSKSIAYDKNLTIKNIKKWKKYYFPPTFGYLYNLYSLDLESELNKNDTAYDYLKENIPGFDFTEIIEDIRKTNNYTNIDSIIEREKNYLFYNDENIPISLFNHFNSISNFDISFIQKYVENLDMALNDFPKRYIIWERKESPEKTRKLVTLDLYDRILTTYLAINIAEKISFKFQKTEAFSYKIANLTKNEVFYNWYNGWSQFIDKIKTYLEIPYLDDWGVFYIDIKHFYDSIDFNVVNKLIEPELDDVSNANYTYLISGYNEKLMRALNNSTGIELKSNDSSRIGVPQGPAYARIISELFLDKILQIFENENNSAYILYRYVDDIVVFYPNETNGKLLYDNLIYLLEINLLKINNEKSFFGGKIRDLTQEQKDKLLHKDKLSYLLQENPSSIILSEDQEKYIYNEFIGTSFNLDYVSYIFNEKTKENVRWKYFCTFKEKIFNSEYGRGSIFLRFYNWIFKNDKYFNLALNDNCFLIIPFNSLNFKAFISELYQNIQMETINIDLLQKFNEKYLSHIGIENIEGDEKNIIRAIIKYLENYNDR